MKTDTYRAFIREKVITDFVKENRRRPNSYELKQLLLAAYEKYAGVEEVGFVGFDIEKPTYGESSSAAETQANIDAMKRDQRAFEERVDTLSDMLESSFRGFIGTSARTARVLRELESRVDNLLITNRSSDIFVAGIEEDFTTQRLVDWANTTAAVENGYVSLGRTSYAELDLSNASVRFTTLTPNGALYKRATGSVENLKYRDGSSWEYLVYTDYEYGRVTLAIEVELTEATDIGEIKLDLKSVDMNKRMTATCLYSTNGETFAEVTPIEQPVTTESLVFNVGVAGVRKLQVLLSKEVHDTKTNDYDQNVYIFAVDHLLVRGAFYKESLYSSLVVGPYEVVDYADNSVFFTKAKIDACTIEPEGTTVNFFLSNDGTTWKPVSHNGMGLNFAAFGDGTVGDSVAYLDTGSSAAALQETAATVRGLDFHTEAFLNASIASTYFSKVPLQTVVLKRNVVIGNYGNSVYGAVAGWSLDGATGRYVTTVYVDAPEGRRMDFGPRTCWVNGFQSSGVIHLPQGYTKVEVSDANWLEVESGLSTLAELKKQDPLYPYNHKLLLEGYAYPAGFSGDKLYNGADEYFGILMEYVPADLFTYLTPEDPRYFRSYTTETVDDQVYFKVKVDKTYSTWKDELISADWVVQRASDNKLWVKALLSSTVSSKTPLIESFKVRVI